MSTHGTTEDHLLESAGVRRTMIGLAVGYLAVFLLLPLLLVFGTALSKGLGYFVGAIGRPDTLAAVRLTLLTVIIAVPLSTAFGLCAAWAVAKFDFRGKSALITMIDLPFSVSPVIAGLVYVLLFGAQGWLGPWRGRHTMSRSSSPCRASCSPACSSPCRSSRAS